MVTVTCGRSPPLGGREPHIQEPAQRLDQGVAAADLRRPRIHYAVRCGAGRGQPVDGLGQDLHPEVVQEPLNPVNPVAMFRDPNVSSTLSTGSR